MSNSSSESCEKLWKMYIISKGSTEPCTCRESSVLLLAGSLPNSRADNCVCSRRGSNTHKFIKAIDTRDELWAAMLALPAANERHRIALFRAGELPCATWAGSGVWSFEERLPVTAAARLITLVLQGKLRDAESKPILSGCVLDVAALGGSAALTADFGVELWTAVRVPAPWPLADTVQSIVGVEFALKYLPHDAESEYWSSSMSSVRTDASGSWSTPWASSRSPSLSLSTSLSLSMQTPLSSASTPPFTVSRSLSHLSDARSTSASGRVESADGLDAELFERDAERLLDDETAALLTKKAAFVGLSLSQPLPRPHYQAKQRQQMLRQPPTYLTNSISASGNLYCPFGSNATQQQQQQQQQQPQQHHHRQQNHNQHQHQRHQHHQQQQLHSGRNNLQQGNRQQLQLQQPHQQRLSDGNSTSTSDGVALDADGKKKKRRGRANVSESDEKRHGRVQQRKKLLPKRSSRSC